MPTESRPTDDTGDSHLPPARRLLYLHGFRSSSRSFKAQLLQARMTALGLGDRFVAPDMPPSPAEAIAGIERELMPGPDDLVVGSSLGGCYATYVAERCGARAVLLNPAVHPARDLAGHVGEQTGYHDGKPFLFHRHYLDELRTIESIALTRPERYLLIAAKGDELLDWREMVARYPGARHRVLEGSDHGLSDFADHQDELLAFGGWLRS